MTFGDSEPKMDKDFRVKLGLHVGANAYISNSITHVESVVFSNNLANYEAAAGELYWNSDDRTLDLDTGGTLLQIGQEEYYLVKNQTGNTIPNGQAVMAGGSLGSSGRILATPAIADGSFPSKYFMGIATESIANGADGFVTQFGVVRQIDTGMFSEGDILYVDPSVTGGLSNTAPIAPNNIITAAIVLNSSNTTGSIFVRPSFTGKLQELEDLVLDNLSDNAIINWSTSNSRFELVQHYSDSSVATYLDVSSATANQILSWTGSNYDWVDQSAGGGGTDYGDSNVDLHLNTASAANNQVLSWTGSDYDWVDQSGGAGSSVTTSNTAPASPSDGDLWFNTDDTTLSVYYEDIDSGQWVVTSGSQGIPGTDGSNAEVYSGNTAPGSPSPRTLWFNTDDASMYFYYDDATSNQWVAISGPRGPEGPQGEQGPAGADGGGVTTGKAIAMAIVFG